MPTTYDEDNPSSIPNGTSRGSSFFKAITLTGIGTAINIVFLLVETMVISHQIDTVNFGIYALLIVVVNFLLMVIDFGTVTAVTQLIASSNTHRQAGYANTAILFRLFNIFVFSIIVLLGRRLLNLLDASGTLITYSIYIPPMLLVAGMDEIQIAILQGKQCYQQMAVAQILRSIFRLGLSVLFIYVFGFGILGPIYSWIISFGISVVYEFLVLPVSKRIMTDWTLLRHMLRFGLPLQLNNFLWFASTSSHSLLISIFMGPSAVAFFEVALRIPNAILRLSQAYTAVYFPTITTLLAEGKKNTAYRLLEHSLNLISFFMALIALVFVLFNQQIITILFSDKYTESGPVFAVLMIALHMNVLITIMGYSLTAAGYPGRSLGANAVREAFMFVTNLLLIPVVGFIGPGYAKVLAFYIANPISIWLLKRSNFNVNMTSFIKQTLLLLFSTALFWIFQPEAIILKIVIIVLFIILNISLSTLNRDDLSIVLPVFVKKKLGMQAEGVPPNQ